MPDLSVALTAANETATVVSEVDGQAEWDLTIGGRQTGWLVASRLCPVLLSSPVAQLVWA